MKDSKIDDMVYLKRMLSEKHIEFSTDLTGTIYLDEVAENCWVMINHCDGYYSLGVYNQDAYENNGCAYDNILFERPDSLARYLKTLAEGQWKGCYVAENLTQWKAETDELHLQWLMQNNPEYVVKYHPQWFNKALIGVVQKELSLQ